MISVGYLCHYLGARETDYPAGEEVSQNSEAGPVGNGGLCTTISSSTEGDDVLGGITVVGCDAEGAAAAPHTADGTGLADGETGKRRWLRPYATFTI